jgi:hypothetical protein
VRSCAARARAAGRHASDTPAAASGTCLTTGWGDQLPSVPRPLLGARRLARRNTTATLAQLGRRTTRAGRGEGAAGAARGACAARRSGRVISSCSAARLAAAAPSPAAARRACARPRAGRCAGRGAACGALRRPRRGIRPFLSCAAEVLRAALRKGLTCRL